MTAGALRCPAASSPTLPISPALKVTPRKAAPILAFRRPEPEIGA